MYRYFWVWMIAACSCSLDSTAPTGGRAHNGDDSMASRVVKDAPATGNKGGAGGSGGSASKAASTQPGGAGASGKPSKPDAQTPAQNDAGNSAGASSTKPTGSGADASTPIPADPKPSTQPDAGSPTVPTAIAGSASVTPDPAGTSAPPDPTGGTSAPSPTAGVAAPAGEPPTGNAFLAELEELLRRDPRAKDAKQLAWLTKKLSSETAVSAESTTEVLKKIDELGDCQTDSRQVCAAACRWAAQRCVVCITDEECRGALQKTCGIRFTCQ